MPFDVPVIVMMRWEVPGLGGSRTISQDDWVLSNRHVTDEDNNDIVTFLCV